MDGKRETGGIGEWRNLWDRAGMLLIFAVMFVLVSLFVDNFFSWVNMKGLALSVATVGIIACTMLFCLAAGDFDLSVGSVVALSGVLAAVVTNQVWGALTETWGIGADSSWAGAAGTASVLAGGLAGVLAGGVVGLANGFVIARLGINALITTLATMQIARGLGYIVSDGKAVGVAQEQFYWLGMTQPLGVAMPVWIMIVFFVVFGVLLQRTIFGRNALAIGGNAEAARLAGIDVRRMKMSIFTLQGLVAGFAGVVLASRMTSGQPTSSQGLELQVISACVLGGVSLTGGVGTMGGVVVGVLIMGTVQNAMNLKNIPPFYQYIASGAILLAAVMLDRLKQARAR